jgi:predicted amidohydrolase
MSISNTRENLTEMGVRLERITKRFPWVRMVLFSELAPFGHSPVFAQTLPGPAEATLCEMAAHFGLWLIPGSMFERHGDDVYNTTPVIDPTGRVVARYRKMFPFLPYEIGVKSGTEFVTFDVPDAGRFGVSICYDMWFPETTRTLAAMGAEVILHPTLTDTIDRDVELAIARANAAVNQCYFIDINGIGDGGVGRSIVLGPNGVVLHQSSVGEEVIPVEVDFDLVRRERKHGIMNLGQPLKSFRDRAVDLTVYDRTYGQTPYLRSLGPIVKPGTAENNVVVFPAHDHSNINNQ